jgi:asparagine synthase (glutamine-hydrolysing)
MEDAYVERVIDLTDASSNRIHNMSLEEARARVAHGPAARVREIDGSFALVARVGRRVRLARSLDRPLRYFLAKQAAGPALVVSDRIDAIHALLEREGLAAQFHPSYTRMVPAHYLVEIELVGCPDPSPSYERYFTPSLAKLPADPDAIGRAYIGALADETSKWLAALPPGAPIGVAFSGGVDSGAVFLVAYHAMRRLGLDPARLKAFTLSAAPGGENGPDLAQARAFLEALGLGLFLEAVEADPAALDPFETVAIIEDYKPLDVESATMALALCRGIRARYPEWRFLLDGDGGDENLKDYPIEENPELTIRSVVGNPLLYQEGWGVGRMKHSLTYSGGQSRSYSRTWAPLRRLGFEGFSPLTRPSVIEVAEAIPFAEMAAGDTARLYALKGEIVARGVEAVTGLTMPVFPKRRFQHGALPEGEALRRLPFGEAAYRSHFLSRYA